MIKSSIDRKTVIKYLLMITCLILFIAGGYRAFTLYNTYRSYGSEIKCINENSDNNERKIMEYLIKEDTDLASYNTKMDSVTLYRLLIESMNTNEIYDNIVNMNLSDKFVKILDEVFDISDEKEHVVITVGTKDYVFYSKSNIDLDKYKYIETNGKNYITWDEYFKQMKNPKVIKKAYEDLVLERSEYVIIKLNGKYPNGTYCTIDDVIDDYHKNGTKNMSDYYILTLGVITDNGDIFGEKDYRFLNKNPNINKIFVFKAVCIEERLNDHKNLINAVSQKTSIKIIEYRNTIEFGNALINIFLITSSIITLMLVIKFLDDENEELINQDKKPKV